MEKDSYFDDLTHFVSTARLLLQNAHDKGTAIEGICLYTSVIDGFLRLAIIYTRIQRAAGHSYEVDKKMMRQDEGENSYTEKEIYSIAHDENIIADDLYSRLVEIYNFRNKAIHRFAISGITYRQIAEKCTEFEDIYKEIFAILVLLEHGPNGLREASAEEKEHFYRSSLKKILGETE